MAIVTEISWNDIFAGKALPDSPARTAFREAVEAVADRARAKLPELHTRVDKAVLLVLNGDVSINANGEGTVASQSNGHVVYAVGKGDGCSCKDHPKAVKGLCKHILSYRIFTRARALAREKLATLDAEASKTEPLPPVQPAPVVSPSTHSEAPASVNCHILLEGRQVQVTLRDTDETRLLARLATLLQQYPIAQPPTEPPTQSTGSAVPDDNPFCHTHKVPLKKFSKDGRTRYSHKTANGRWCRGE